MDKIKSYKSICFKIGIIMSIFFASSILCTLLMNYISAKMAYSVAEINVAGSTIVVPNIIGEYILRLVLSALFLYGIPIISAMAVLKPSLNGMYKKPVRLAKAIGNFPAMYGLGQLTNLTTLLVVWLISKLQNALHRGGLDESNLERSFGTMESLIPPNIMPCGIALFVHMVFAAAIFEEFLCRGLLLNALKPYGNGFAIMVTGFLFGIMHGNLQQFFYTFILGIVLAYITVQTGSILASTLLHAMFNAVAAIMMLFISTGTIQKTLLSRTQTQGGGDELVLAMFGIYIALFLGLLIAGIALALKKLTRLKTYKANNPFSDISTKQKTAIFFTSIPVIIMLALMVDRFAGGLIASLILNRL